MAQIPRIIGGFEFSIWSERESMEDREEERVIAELERGDGEEPKKVAILDCLSQCIMN